MLTIAKLKIAVAVVATAVVVTTTSLVVVQSVAQAEVEEELPAFVLPKNEMPGYVLWSHDRFLKGDQRAALTWPLLTVARQPKLDAATTDSFSGNGKLELDAATDQSHTVVVMVSPPFGHRKILAAGACASR